MTRELWSHLDTNKNEYHLLSSELLLRLHSLSLPSKSSAFFSLPNLSVVEKEILKYLFSCPRKCAFTTGNVSPFLRFFIIIIKLILR